MHNYLTVTKILKRKTIIIFDKILFFDQFNFKYNNFITKG